MCKVVSFLFISVSLCHTSLSQKNYFERQIQGLTEHQNNLKKYVHLQLDPVVISSKKNYKLGDSSPILLKVKEHLQYWGAGAVLLQSGNLYDLNLLQAVKRFQKQNGLEINGIIDISFIKKLNRTPSEIDQLIELNLQRLHALQQPNAFSSCYMVINIPEYQLYFFHGDTLLKSMKVVVGKKTTPTMFFQTTLKSIVFCPFWNVPTSILRKEIMPAYQKNKHYLTRNHFEWFQGQLRQTPGPWNALGKIKFIVPNNYQIFLHDTPVKKLFSKKKRAFSHGCIRLEDAQALAQVIMEREGLKGDVVLPMNCERKQNEKYLQISSKIEVYVIYITTTISAQGELMIWEDIYDKDRPMVIP